MRLVHEDAVSVLGEVDATIVIPHVLIAIAITHIHVVSVAIAGSPLLGVHATPSATGAGVRVVVVPLLAATPPRGTPR